MNALRQTEQAILVEGREWTRHRLEQQLQQDAAALPSLCPKTGRPLTKTRWRNLQLETVAGLVKLRVRHGWSEALNRSVCPAREAWDLDAYQRTSPELQARLAYTATEVPSYERAARMAQTWGTPVSDTCIHFQVQQLGSAAATIVLPTPAPIPREPEFSLVIEMDGWMVRERGPDWGAGLRKKSPERIAYREVKSAIIYRLQQRAETDTGRGLLLEKFIVAMPPETAPVDFGAAVLAEEIGRAHV